MSSCSEALIQEAKDGRVEAVAENCEREEVRCAEVREDGVEDLDVWLVPVSYTHLTLPTKRIV